jgi:hypothetical protein
MTNLISARVLQDSISPEGVRFITLEIEYPRFILAELNTHRMLSKNSASSRAIPVHTLHEHIKQNTAQPVHWGKNQAGMQAREELNSEQQVYAQELWLKARDSALAYSQQMSDVGLHKQVSNRITEPWMLMKTVISGTEWRNFFWLRNHPDAQPEIQLLAQKMQEAIQLSNPQLLLPGEWHVPYVSTRRDPVSGHLAYFDGSDNLISAEQARIISASCCAQVSYRKTDASPEKAQKIFDQLINSQPCHASPVEHQATPVDDWMREANLSSLAKHGITHQTTDGRLWSGNLCGWIQYRKTIPGEAQW